MVATCYDITGNTYWGLCPSLPASILFTTLFGLTTIAHIVQAIKYRKPYCWVISASALAQLLCYIFRTLSIQNPFSFNDYVAWFVLILVAPLFTNAFAYMVVARTIFNFKASKSIWHIKAWRLSYIFVTLDIIAFLVQVYGAASASGNNLTVAKVYLGLHIYMGGVGMQQLFIIIFSLLTVQVLLAVRRETTGDRQQKAVMLLYTVLAVLALITLRIIFRMCEYAQGLDSTIPIHEAYQYCLDSLPMLLALWVFNLYHPGQVMPGRESEMPSLKQRRRDKKTASGLETAGVEENEMRVSMGSSGVERDLTKNGYQETV